MRNRQMLHIVLLFLPFALFANTDDEKRVKEIKKNTAEYIYSSKNCDVNAGETEEVCYDLAHNELLQKITEYIDNDSELAGASSVLLKDIQKSVQKISFEKNDVDLNLICVTLYINKKDIKAGEKSKAVAEKKTEAVSKKEVKETPAASSAPAKSLTAESVVTLKIKAETEKENETLAELVKFQSYTEHRQILSRKSADGEVKTKLTKDFNGVKGCYWIIYNENKQMIAMIEKTLKYNMLTGEEVDLQDFNLYAKLWIYIYND